MFFRHLLLNLSSRKEKKTFSPWFQPGEKWILIAQYTYPLLLSLLYVLKLSGEGCYGVAGVSSVAEIVVWIDFLPTSLKDGAQLLGTHGLKLEEKKQKLENGPVVGRIKVALGPALELRMGYKRTDCISHPLRLFFRRKTGFRIKRKAR